MAWGNESRHARGYGADWDRLRKRIMSRDCGLCRVCLAKDRVTPATAVDHIVCKAKGGTDDESNLQAICTACHTVKTSIENGKGLRKRAVISADGWPLRD